MTLDAARQAEHLAWLARGEECAFGSTAGLPRPLPDLAALSPEDPAVFAVHDGGLTARVLGVALDGQRFAVKQARAECKVRNADGATSFLNELRTHQHLVALRSQGTATPGIVAPLCGSLHLGVLVSPWIDGTEPDLTDPRAARALLASGLSLLRHGVFEWDYAPGNLLDDGHTVWLFDFGYAYRFDPLTQFNSAGTTGTEHPEHHWIERIESRALFGQLLDHPEPEAGFLRFKREALAAAQAWRAELAVRGAQPFILADWDARIADWTHRLAHDPTGLYLACAWQAHHSDLLDDLKGQSCTPRTLRRVDWLLTHAARLGRVEAIPTLQAQGRQAQAWQHP